MQTQTISGQIEDLHIAGGMVYINGQVEDLHMNGGMLYNYGQIGDLHQNGGVQYGTCRQQQQPQERVVYRDRVIENRVEVVKWKYRDNEETHRATNMANGKQTTLKVGIDEYLQLINATVTSKNETY